MSYENNSVNSDGFALSLQDLRLKQSVRTTFKLPREIINLLTAVAGQLGIKQKSLLDQLTEDRDTLTQLAGEVSAGEGSPEREPKTYVMSRNSLQAINDVAKKEQVPRDVLVEVSIRRLLPIIEKELENHHNRKRIFEEMQTLYEGIKQLRSKAQKQLGDDDELFTMIDGQFLLAQKNRNAARKIITRGMPMEDW